jgi:hypothetical protein
MVLISRHALVLGKYKLIYADKAGGKDKCTVRIFRQKSTLEDAIEFHALAPLEASMRVTNDIPLGCSLLLPVGTVNFVQTLKGCRPNSLLTTTMAAKHLWRKGLPATRAYLTLRPVNTFC